jgi:hypothetical protein
LEQSEQKKWKGNEVRGVRRGSGKDIAFILEEIKDFVQRKI